MLLFVTVVLVTSSSCRPLPLPVTDVIDCIKAEASTDWPVIEAQLKPDEDAGNWSKLATDAIALAPTVALHVAECVAEEMFQQYLSVKRPDIASTNSAATAREQIRSYNQGTSTKKPVYHAQKVCPATPNGCNL